MKTFLLSVAALLAVNTAASAQFFQRDCPNGNCPTTVRSVVRSSARSRVHYAPAVAAVDLPAPAPVVPAKPMPKSAAPPVKAVPPAAFVAPAVAERRVTTIRVEVRDRIGHVVDAKPLRSAAKGIGRAVLSRMACLIRG